MKHLNIAALAAVLALVCTAQAQAGTRYERHHYARQTAQPNISAKRAQQQALCNEQAAKRRALGIPSKVTWDNPNTCRASGGMVETGKL